MCFGFIPPSSARALRKLQLLRTHKMPLAALLLAAGASSRWGNPKALLPYADTTLITHLARTAHDAGCAPLIRVLGSHRDAIIATAPASETTGLTDIFNPTWADGMGNSIACGTRAALTQTPDLRGLIIIPCDQPLITSALLRMLAAIILNDHDPARIALCDYENNTLGQPSAFGRAHFPELLTLTGDQGARSITRTHETKITRVPFPNGCWDIDSPEAWARFHQR
jgi:molybdenum cofactor cytidylyltransferase